MQPLADRLFSRSLFAQAHIPGSLWPLGAFHQEVESGFSRLVSSLNLVWLLPDFSVLRSPQQTFQSLVMNLPLMGSTPHKATGAAHTPQRHNLDRLSQEEWGLSQCMSSFAVSCLDVTTSKLQPLTHVA